MFYTCLGRRRLRTLFKTQNTLHVIIICIYLKLELCIVKISIYNLYVTPAENYTHITTLTNACHTLYGFFFTGHGRTLRAFKNKIQTRHWEVRSKKNRHQPIFIRHINNQTITNIFFVHEANPNRKPATTTPLTSTRDLINAEIGFNVFATRHFFPSAAIISHKNVTGRRHFFFAPSRRSSYTFFPLSS